MSLLKDEQGKVSTARCAFWIALLSVLYLAVLGPDRSNQVWETLREICLALIAWAGGSRMMNVVAQLRSKPGASSPAPTGITPGD